MNPLRIGTRGSALARWQAEHVAGLLRPLTAPREVELVTIQTEGDRSSNESLSVIGGLGVFTKEIQRALLAGTVDVAVHSLKDLPTETVDGLTLAAVPPRAGVSDVFVSSQYTSLDVLPVDARIATGSVRRRALLLHRWPTLTFVDIRGNVDTRLAKLDAGEVDALVLARAGLERLGLQGRITEELDPTWMVPAVGQGALGIECRADDVETLQLLRAVDNWGSRVAVMAERAFLRALGGGCQVPIGAWAYVEDNALVLGGVVAAADGSWRRDGVLADSPLNAELVGAELAERLR
jgi:hydroxymethylbilane synthase